MAVGLGLFFLYLVIVVLSLYTLIGLVASIDRHALKKHLSGNVPERLGGGVLILLRPLRIIRIWSHQIIKMKAAFLIA